MAAEFSDNQQTVTPESIKRASLKGFQWAENVKKAYLGIQVDPTFRSRLEMLVARNFDSGGLTQMPSATAGTSAAAGGSATPEPLKRQNALNDLAAMGQLNQTAALLNVAHLTGDTYMMKSVLNVYKNNDPKEEEVEPVEPAYGGVDG